ncbi:MAG: DNA-directed RNA polymerase subunit alpha, partial [Planctomycetia bacterium]|nr:DNA-directed RNA polymerase subunit alpha [Planctomycetia bacterium]
MRVRWRGLELPSQLVCETKTATYGKFTAEPFERGFGVTIGNSLRRILLSSLEGSAITRLKLDGATHEFTTLPGVLEDVTDIVLNTKAVIVRSYSEQPRIVRIDRDGVGLVTAGDIRTDSEVEILNPELPIATLTAEDAGFHAEMVVETGRGYVPVAEQIQRSQEIGVIPLDAAYSPVTKVRYDVEETRVGQKTNYDRLTIEIWTNGSVSPDMALVEAAKILRKHLNPFVQYGEPGESILADGRGAGSDAEGDQKYAASIQSLRLSV